jgi:hypothetical protein
MPFEDRALLCPALQERMRGDAGQVSLVDEELWFTLVHTRERVPKAAGPTLLCERARNSPDEAGGGGRAGRHGRAGLYLDPDLAGDLRQVDAPEHAEGRPVSS